MSALVNTHPYQGIILGKSGPFAVNDSMNISFLYCRSTYMTGGKERQEDARFSCFSWGESSSKISQLLPGDEVSFNFNLTGRYQPDRKGTRFGEPVCWTEPVISSKIEIVNTTQRQLYNNDPSQRPTPEPVAPKFEYPTENIPKQETATEEFTDLPF